MDVNTKDSRRPSDPIALLRSKLRSIESALHFDGEPYPDCLVKFPWELTGRGFFPGGDGLWREPSDSAIVGPPTHPYPFDGIMFIGQDFGSVDRYPPQAKPWELDNVATWRFLTKRIKQSGIPGASSFFTNALLGLRKEGPTIGQNQCISNPKYTGICRDFLAYQIEVLDPRFIVIFKSVDQVIYSPLFSSSSSVQDNMHTVVCKGRTRVVLVTQHPSSDHGVINRFPENYCARCKDLAEGWRIANEL